MDGVLPTVLGGPEDGEQGGGRADWCGRNHVWVPALELTCPVVSAKSM